MCSTGSSGHVSGRGAAGAGALFEAQGKFANATTAQRARTQELTKTDAASKALLDVRIADGKSAQGDVVIADANLKTAQRQPGQDATSPPRSPVRSAAPN